MTRLAVLLAGIVVLAEAVCAALWFVAGDDPAVALLLGLLAVLLPYLWFICLAAQVSATLHALGHFAVPSLIATVLNVCWIAGALLIAPYWADDKQAQAYVLATCILIGGSLQLGVQLPVLWRLGFRYDYNWSASRSAVRRVVITMAPMTIGLAITQINTLLDSVIAWCLAAAPDADRSIVWLGGFAKYPLESWCRRGDLLRRATVSISSRHTRHRSGHGDLSAVEPACRAR